MLWELFPGLGVAVTQQQSAIIQLIFRKRKACLITEPLLLEWEGSGGEVLLKK